MFPFGLERKAANAMNVKPLITGKMNGLLPIFAWSSRLSLSFVESVWVVW